MSRYIDLRRNPLKISKKDKEKKLHTVMLTMVSVMCDNVGYLKIARKDIDTVTVSHYNDSCALAFSNLQAEPNAKEMIKWAAVNNDLDEIVRLAGSGTSAVSKIMVMEKPSW